MTLTGAEHRRVTAFQGDLADGIRAILASLGCRTLAPALGPSDVCLAYANYKFRRIHMRPRRVLRSDTLRGRTDLPIDEPAAIDAIEAKFVCGADLYPHQSTTLARPLAKDGLLADWRIQHLHLGLASGKRATAPFVNRSCNVLLVRVTDDAAYFVDCLAHGGTDEPEEASDPEALWWNVDPPETLHRNWPDSIADLNLDDYAPKLSWSDHRKLRSSKGCNFTTAVTTSDGTSYLLSETGILASGHSSQARSHADALQNKVTTIALDRRDDEKLVVEGDHCELHLRVEPR